MPDYKVLSCDCGYEVTAIDEVPRGLRGAAPRHSCRRFDSRTTRLRRLLLLVALTAITTLVLAAAPAGSGTGGPLVKSSGEPAADDICTIASIERRATVEVQVAHAEDFCELLSQALAISVFRTPLFVAPGVLWHYAGSEPSCQLRFGRTRNRIVVRNSVRTCRWFARHWSGWRVEAGAGVAVGVAHASVDGNAARSATPSYPPLAPLPRACPRLAVLLPAARSIGDAMPDDTVLSCECGYEVTATDEAELIEEIRRHARDTHGVAFSIEDALLVVLRSELEPESFSTSTHRREE